MWQFSLTWNGDINTNFFSFPKKNHCSPQAGARVCRARVSRNAAQMLRQDMNFMLFLQVTVVFKSKSIILRAAHNILLINQQRGWTVEGGNATLQPALKQPEREKDENEAVFRKTLKGTRASLTASRVKAVR